MLTQFGKLGFGYFGALGVRGGGAGAAVPVGFPAPSISLDLTSDTGTPGDDVTFDTTPTLVIEPGTDFAEGDVLTLRYAQVDTFVGAVTIVNTIDSIEMLLASIAETISELAGGTWYFSAKHARGAEESEWGDTYELLIDVPVITSPASVHVDEHEQIAHTLTASKSGTWVISGGADAAFFDIVGAMPDDTAELEWLGAADADYEDPDDAGADNIYNLQVSITDADGNVITQSIVVYVGAVDEQPLLLLNDGTSFILLNNGTDRLRLN